MGVGKVSYIHGDRDHHQLRVETNKRLILLKLMLLDKAFLYCTKEIPIEPCIDEEDKDFGRSIPVFINTNNAILTVRINAEDV